jgi:hypothetical protein
MGLGEENRTQAESLGVLERSLPAWTVAGIFLFIDNSNLDEKLLIYNLS